MLSNRIVFANIDYITFVLFILFIYLFIYLFSSHSHSKQQWLQLNMKSLGVITWKLFFIGGDTNLIRGSLLGGGGGIFLGEGRERTNFWLVGGSPHPPSSENTSVRAMLIHTLIHIHLPILSKHIQPIVGIQQRWQAYVLLENFLKTESRPNVFANIQDICQISPKYAQTLPLWKNLAIKKS